MRALVLAALLLALAAPIALAHIDTSSEAKPLVVGPYSALLQPVPDPAFEDSAITFRAIFTRVDTGAYATRLTASLDVRAPSGTNETKALEPDGTGYFLALFAAREAGDHVVRLIVREANGTAYETRTTLTIYPDLPYRVQPADPMLSDPVEGVPYALGVRVVDNVRLEPNDALSDLTVRFEHWTDDHAALLGSQERPLSRDGVGLWTTRHTFSEKGMYHLLFASRSGGFNTTEVPLLHVYANEPAPGQGDSAGGMQTPGAPLAAVVLGLAVLALLRPR